MIDKLMKSQTWDLAEEKGVYIGIANPNVPVIFDTWRKSNRNVEHMNILGVMGDGKGFSIRPKEVKKRGLKNGEET